MSRVWFYWKLQWKKKGDKYRVHSSIGGQISIDSVIYCFNPSLWLRIREILFGSHGLSQQKLFPLAMDVSCDHGLIDGMSGTRAEKAEPPIASSSTPLLGKWMWKQVMETQKDETSLEREHCHWIKPSKALTNKWSCHQSLHESRWSWTLFRLLCFRAVF